MILSSKIHASKYKLDMKSIKDSFNFCHHYASILPCVLQNWTNFVIACVNEYNGGYKYGNFQAYELLRRRYCLSLWYFPIFFCLSPLWKTQRVTDPVAKPNVLWRQRQKQELLETKTLGYLTLKGFKEIELNGPGTDAVEKNENPYVELIFEWSLPGISLAEARDKKYECLKVYVRHSKPRIIIS